MNIKKRIVFGRSFIPFLIVIVGSIIYFSSSLNNVHRDRQNNLQLEEEKREKERLKKQREKYIPFLDDYQAQISFWFIYYLIFHFFWDNKPEIYFKKFKEKLISLWSFYYEFFWVMLLVISPILFFFGEFFIYLLTCWINKKQLKKAFFINRRFWWQSWTNALWTFLVFNIFGFINIFFASFLKYLIGFIDFFIKKNIIKNMNDKHVFSFLGTAVFYQK